MLLLGTFGLAGSLAACGGHLGLGSGASSEPNLDASVIAQADPKAVAQPLAAYMFDAADTSIIDKATLIGANQCMAQFGFPPAAGVLSPPSDIEMWARYGLWDPASAQTGYLSPEQLHSSMTDVTGYPNPSDALTVYVGGVTTYNGLPVPTGGCYGVAVGVVRRVPGVDDLSGFVQGLYLEARQRSMQDSRVTPLLDAWQTCMKQKGWNYSGVFDPFGYWDQPPRRGTNKQLTLASISADEKASAADDLSCKHSTGLLGTWLAADVAYQGLIVQREAQKLGNWSKGMDQIRANANNILAGGWPQTQHS
jgi:hypothetical protein